MDQKFQIYIIENEDPLRNSSGGVMTYIINLSKYFTSLSFKPILLAAGPPGDQHQENALPFDNLRVSFSQISNIKYLLLLFYHWKKIPNKSNSIIHCQRADYMLPFILFRRKAKLICTLHGMRDFGFAFKKGRFLGIIYSAISALCLKKADQVIVVDQNSYNAYLKKYPWLGKKLNVISTGIDLEVLKPLNKAELRGKYKLSPEDKVIIFIGRLEIEKNVDFLIQACSGLSEKIKEVKLLIIGNGSKLRELKELAASLSTDSVIFLGEIENIRIPELINTADVLALCSTYEGSPTVIKEALACNIPVVSTDVGDAKIVLSEFKGSLICAKEINAYQQALEEILINPAVHDYGETILKYSHTSISKKTFDVYMKVCN